MGSGIFCFDLIQTSFWFVSLVNPLQFDGLSIYNSQVQGQKDERTVTVILGLCGPY